jgi:hypothetical protein
MVHFSRTEWIEFTTGTVTWTSSPSLEPGTILKTTVLKDCGIWHHVVLYMASNVSKKPVASTARQKSSLTWKGRGFRFLGNTGTYPHGTVFQPRK